MKTLKETLLDRNYEASMSDVLFDKFYNHPKMAGNFRTDGIATANLVSELIQDNTEHLAELTDDPDDILMVPFNLIKQNKFKQVVAKMKGKKSFWVDLPYQSDFNAEVDDLYCKCKKDKVAELEFEQILYKVDLIFSIYRIDNYYYMFLIGDDGSICGFIGSN